MCRDFLLSHLPDKEAAHFHLLIYKLLSHEDYMINSLQMKHTDFSDDASTLARPDTQQSLELKSVISSSLPLYLAVHKSQTRQAGTVA